MRKIILSTILCCLMAVSTVIFADEQSQADAAVANTLFEYDGSEEYASYRVSDNGAVDLIFARNTPDKLYEDILNKLQNHPHISSVLASKGGPACRLF